MAVSKNGKNGMRGKVGNVVTYQLNGQWVARSIGTITKAPTEAQLNCRERMRLINLLLAPVKEFINVGFIKGRQTKALSSHNLAYRYNLAHALKGEYPNLQIDYPSVRFTAGEMPTVSEVAVGQTAEGIVFRWQLDEDSKLVRWNDQAMLMAYMPDEGDAVFQIGGNRRNEGQGLLKIPKYQKTMILETYLSFISADHRHRCNSIYTGRIIW